MKYDVIVIGGGASGMTAAICAARSGQKVLLIEKNRKLGRKVAASGNGKCNLTNERIAPEHYHDAYPDELGRILKQYDRKAILDFMKTVGIVCKEKRGCYYPMSEQAAVVVQLLEAELWQLGVTVRLEERLLELEADGRQGFRLVTDKAELHGRNVILSCGGMAAPKLGAEGTGYRILETLGHTVIKPLPALVQLVARERYIKKLSGVRCEARICLTAGNKACHEEGEIIFTDTGISGIPVFQLSRYAAEAAETGREALLSVDVLPACEEKQLLAAVAALKKHNPGLPLEYLFRSFCNHKLVYALLYENGYEPEAPCGRIPEQELAKILALFRSILLHITGTNGFEHAQVTKGGVPLSEVNHDTMESLRVPGLFITGELLDVDGICGGYNLHFAWASGIMAGNAVNRVSH